MASIAKNEKVANLSVSKRIHAGKCCVAFEIGIYLAAQTALVIATAALLWHPKEGKLEEPLLTSFSKVCNDPWTREENNGVSYPKYSTAPCENFVDIYYQFTTILQLYFAFFVIQWVRMVIIFLALCTQNAGLVKIFEGLGCSQCCFGLACLIILHVFRFQPAGKLASMDFMTMDEKKKFIEAYKELWDKLGELPPSGQFFRGQFLLGLVIYIWVGGFVLCIV
jgi:hypothetical protein